MTPSITLLCYPETPPPDSILVALCDHLGYTISGNPTQPFDVAFKYFEATFFSPMMLEDLADIRDEVINRKSLDISKTALGEVFQKVFGYPITVDPTRHTGRIVRKSNIDALRNGEILHAPHLAIAEDAVYQQFIDSTIAGTEHFTEFIVPIHAQEIPLVYRLTRENNQRFTRENIQVDLEDPTQSFKKTELQLLKDLASELGLEFGELEILRDNQDGQIYVIDVDNCGLSFPTGLTAEQKKAALEKLSSSFVSLVVNRF